MKKHRQLRQTAATDAITEAIDRLIVAEAKTRRERALSTVGESFASDIARAFRVQQDTFVTVMRQSLTESIVSRIGPGEYRVREASAPAWGEWESWWAEAETVALGLLTASFVEALGAAIETGYRIGIADLAVEYAFDLENQRAVSWAQARAAEAIKGINDTTRDALRRIITDAVQSGASYSETASAIRDLTAFSAERAERIAVYEAAKAYEWANRDVASDLRDNGLEMMKSWLSAGDQKVDAEICGPNEAQGWIALGEPFQSGDDTAPAHVGCRCTTLYQRAGSAA